MNRIFFGLTVLLFLSAIPSRGQLSVSYEGDSNATVNVKGFAEYVAIVKNDGPTATTFFVDRTENNLPDKQWFSTICMEDLCYSAEVSRPPDSSIEPGEEYHVKFTIYVGDTAGKQGTFNLRFVGAGFGGFEGFEFGNITLSISAVDESASVPVVVSAETLPYPNPTSSSLSVPLAGMNAQSLEVYTPSGVRVEEVGNLSSAGDLLNLDTESYTPGLYYYRIKGRERTFIGTFQVIR